MSRTTSTKAKFLNVVKANEYGIYDSTPYDYLDINKLYRKDIVSKFLSKDTIAKSVIGLKWKLKRINSFYEIDFRTQLPEQKASQIRRKVIFPNENLFTIDNVTAEGSNIFNEKPFTLKIEFSNPGKVPLCIASATVLWEGVPFTVEKEISKKENEKGFCLLEFKKESTLPIGHAEFRITLYNTNGTLSNFVKSFYVLPYNPLSLGISPAGATVTGSWSARGAFNGGSNTFVTQIKITIANGDNQSVNMNRLVTWSFWDGGVGSGTSIENGSFNWPSAITVPAHSVWEGFITFSSPNGSGINNTYRRKEDMVISISMNTTSGRNIKGEITCRVMFAYGVNIIKVGDFTSQEHTDLYNSVDLLRQIYERRDITLRGVNRHIINNALAGGSTILDSEDEFRDMLEFWSVPNDFIDVFVVQSFNWGGFNGFAGDIPGPTSKTGRRDGVAVQKSGFTNSSGVKRLNTNVLSQLIGHELGHYLGLSHITTSNNLMLSNTGSRGPDLSYAQYRTIMSHGWVVFI